MNIFLKTLSFITLTFLISGCSQKILTVKSLHPSKIEKEKIYTIKVDDFLYDDINQKNRIEEKISNKIIDGKKLFIVRNGMDVDAILNGTVVDSSLNSHTYYRTDVDYTRCRYYKPRERSKDGERRREYRDECMEYMVRLTTCEARDYHVSTNVRVIKPMSQTLLFTKTYDKSYSENVCFDRYPYYITRANKYEINSQLANKISEEVINDISPHYAYYDIPIIDELDDKNFNFTKIQEQKFERIVEFLLARNLETAKIELEKLNSEFQNKNPEVLYNLALTYEGLGQLGIAHNLYKQANLVAKDVDQLNMINFAIDRTANNLEEKIKAKSQLQ